MRQPSYTPVWCLCCTRHIDENDNQRVSRLKGVGQTQRVFALYYDESHSCCTASVALIRHVILHGDGANVADYTALAAAAGGGWRERQSFCR